MAVGVNKAAKIYSRSFEAAAGAERGSLAHVPLLGIDLSERDNSGSVRDGT